MNNKITEEEIPTNNLLNHMVLMNSWTGLYSILLKVITVQKNH